LQWRGHTDPKVAVGAPARSGGRRKEGGGGQADKKSNNPRLTGGEKVLVASNPKTVITLLKPLQNWR